MSTALAREIHRPDHWSPLVLACCLLKLALLCNPAGTPVHPHSRNVPLCNARNLGENP